jgi:DNA-binding Lrp family transcriptional regulator
MKRNIKNGRLQNKFTNKDILEALTEAKDVQSGKTITDLSNALECSKRTVERRIKPMVESGEVKGFKAGFWIYWRE